MDQFNNSKKFEYGDKIREMVISKESVIPGVPSMRAGSAIEKYVTDCHVRIWEMIQLMDPSVEEPDGDCLVEAEKMIARWKPWGICYVCGDKMIQGGDHDAIDADDIDCIESNFHCPKCSSQCLFMWRVGQ